jgi:hypothetical protein
MMRDDCSREGLLFRLPDRREFVVAFNHANQSAFFERADRVPAHTGRAHDLVVFEPACWNRSCSVLLSFGISFAAVVFFFAIAR